MALSPRRARLFVQKIEDSEKTRSLSVLVGCIVFKKSKIFNVYGPSSFVTSKELISCFMIFLKSGASSETGRWSALLIASSKRVFQWSSLLAPPLVDVVVVDGSVI